MIAKKIYEQAKLHVDDDFTWVHGRRWLNEAIRIIATTCEKGSFVKDETTIEAEKNIYYDLPDNIGINAVYKDEKGRNNRVHNYVEEGDRIHFEEDGSYIVEYKKLPHDILNESDTPQVHELYHLPISYWIASREKLRFNPMDADGHRLSQEFYTQIGTVNENLTRTNRVRKIYV